MQGCSVTSLALMIEQGKQLRIKARLWFFYQGLCSAANVSHFICKNWVNFQRKVGGKLMWNSRQISLATVLLLKTLQLCGGFFPHTMIGLLKSQGLFANHMKGNLNHSSDNSLISLVDQNRDIGATLQTLLPMVNLPVITSVMQASIAELRNLTLASLKSSGFLIAIA